MKRDRLTTERLHLILMLALTFSTGVVDAVGYLGLDRVFTGNMTGNVVILGMALAGGASLPVLRPALALLGFMFGAAVAGRLLRPDGPGWGSRSSGAFLAVAAGLAALAAVAFLVPEADRGPTGTVVTTVLAILMGVQAATARRLKVTDVTTVVVTSTIVGLSSESRLAGGTGGFWRRRSLAVVLILLGALAGGTALRWHLGLGLALSAALTAAVVGVGHARHRKDAHTAARGRLDVTPLSPDRHS
ncbi:YoaK family protein [Sinomonas notoginsengisoli]|uniref:YoaK family protein n=1 Tax=Sinomonas notoginsengisoli TaxID=1457311 RepID=UPI001F1857E5|nr:YoaK family protein [Sinomonas notoginsengisoli]